MINLVSYPTESRNYCIFDDKIVKKRLAEKEKSLIIIEDELKNSKNEDVILQDLYILNLMLDENVKGVDKLYPTLSNFNQTNSPYIQTFLSGIYRKIKVPDAFGPLCVMLIQNAISPHKDINFDPNEEIGGAILDYLA